MENSTPVSASTARLSTIYALLDTDGAVRYVGITVTKLQARLRRHMNSAKHGDRTHRSNWLRSLSQPPAIVEIEQTYDRDREVFWIAHYKELGCRLTNKTDGGEGAPGLRHSPESIARMKEYHTGKKLTDAHKAAIGDGQRGKIVSDITRARNGASQKGRVFSEEHRSRLSAAMKKKYQDRPELRELVGEQSRARLEDPVYRANLAKAHLGHTMSAEARAKLSAAGKGRKKSVEHRAKIGAAHRGRKASDASRAKMSVGQKRRFSTSNDRTQGTLDFGT